MGNVVRQGTRLCALLVITLVAIACGRQEDTSSRGDVGDEEWPPPFLLLMIIAI